MPYYRVGVVLVFVKKVVRTRKGYLVYIFVYLFGCHAYATVAYDECAFFLVNNHPYRQVAKFSLEVALHGIRLQFLRCVNRIRDYLTQENLVVAVKKLFDDGEYVFGCYPNFTFCHISVIFVC